MTIYAAHAKQYRAVNYTPPPPKFCLYTFVLMHSTLNLTLYRFRKHNMHTIWYGVNIFFQLSILIVFTFRVALYIQLDQLYSM